MDDSVGRDASVVRSEEQLRATTRRVAVGRAVLRKRIVTEERTITVQVRHEEADFEVQPLDTVQDIDPDGGPSHRALPEFVLFREEIVVTKRLVPVERVRLHLQQVTDQQDVTGTVRREQVTVDRGVSEGTDRPA